MSVVDQERVTAFAPLRVPAYRRMWPASTVSAIGTFLQMTAGPWLMLELTGSPLMVSLVTTALLLPRMLLTLPAGALADVMDRRTIILAGHLVSAVPCVVLAALAWTGRITPGTLLMLTFLIGTGNAIGLPSFQTLVPDLVPRPLLAQAITLNSAAFNTARSIGPSIGGALVAAGLTHVAFGANAVSYLAVVGVLLTFPKDTVEDRSQRHLWRSTVVGLRYVRFTRSIRVLIVLAAVFAVTTACVQALLPSLASDDLGLGAAGFGVLFGLFGAGALVAAGTRERIRMRLGRRMLPGTITAFGCAGIALGLAPHPGLAAVAIFACGLTWVWTLTTLNASIQLQAPRWVRGRIVSLFLLTMGLQPIGAVLAGLIAESFGSGRAVAAMTALTLVLGIASFRIRLPVLGELREPEAAPIPESPISATHAEQVGGTPIVVTTTFEIDPARLEEFLEIMRRLRRTRLRTGATRWSLFRDASQPHVVTEMFSVPDWQEHLAQHARIDAAAADTIRHARAFDVTGRPRTRHLAGLDLDRDAPPLSDQLLTVHADLHRTDGSIPLDGGDAPR
jgi:MFS family permease